MKTRKSIVRYMIALAGTAAFVVPSVASAQYCKPDFGKRMLAWVEDDSATQSRDLAELDYRLRTFNYMLLTFETANAELNAASRELDRIAEEIRRQEASSPADSVLAAVERERNATAMQNALFRVRTQLDRVQAAHAWLRKDPDKQRFYSDGLHNVGRATLLASFVDLGDPSHESLPERYGVMVRTTYSEQTGEVSTDVEYHQAGEITMTDSAVSIAAYYAGSFAGFVYFAYFFARSEYDSDVCRSRIREQKELLTEALALVPKKIIQLDEQFELYQKIYGENRASFAEHSATQVKAEVRLDDRWRGLFAANAQRIVAANSVLTAAKVEALQIRDGSDSRITRMFDAMGRVEMLEATNRLHNYVIEGQVRLLGVCDDVDGLAVLEDQRDALAYARASYAVVAKQAAFAPLRPVLSGRDAAATDAQLEIEDVARRLRDRPCPSLQPLVTRHFENKFEALDDTKQMIKFNIVAPYNAIVEIQSDLSFCAMWRSGGAYQCRGSSGGSGSPYSGQFTGAGGDARVAILGRASDGGYARDPRSPSVKVQEAVSNIAQRIEVLRQSAPGPMGALSEWRAVNGAALTALSEHQRQSLIRENQEREAFRLDHEDEVRSANTYIDTFLERPAQASRAVTLMRDVSAADLSLPDLPTETVPPQAPVLPGLRATERAYGADSSPAVREIEQEQLRASRDLAEQPQLKALAATALAHARRFERQPGSNRVVNALVRDSAAIRYFATSARDRLELSTVDADGNWSRVSVTDPENLPAETVIARASAFELQAVKFQARAGQVRASQATPDNRNAMRGRVLGEAEDLADKASVAFYSGDLVLGAQLQQYSMLVLDIALSFTPGVGWARDLYEAISGKDLLSGEALDGFGRFTAVIGAVTGGIGDDALDVARVFRKIDIGESVPRVNRVLEANKKLRSDNVIFSEHARIRQAQRNISQGRIDDVLTSGTRYWDAEEKTLVAFEAGLSNGASRVGVAVNTDTMTVTTVMKTRTSDEKFAKAVIEGTTKLRYRRLPGSGPSLPTPPTIH